MSLPVPLTVRLATDRKDMFVTQHARDLMISSSVPGGYGAGTVALDRPLSSIPDEIAAYGKMYVYDGRNGGLLYDGRLEDPGRGASGDGQVWSLTAVGGGAHTLDNTVPLIYADLSLERAVRSSSSRKSMDTEIDGTAIKIMARRGDAVGSSSFAQVNLLQFADVGAEIARIEFAWDSGITDSDWRVHVFSQPSNTQLLNVATNTAGGALASYTIPSGDNNIQFRLQRQNTSQTIANDATWITFSSIAVTGRRYVADGTVKSSGYTATVTAADVVADLLGRLLPKIDGVNAVVQAGSGYGIDQLAYLDGATAAKVLEDLMRLEAAMFWAVWGTGANGLYAFEWKQWPTQVRFEATANDGFFYPGSTLDLYDRVRVRWRDRTGRIRSTLRTQVVDVLTNAGITRTGSIDLADEAGSQANADKAGDAFLAEHQYPVNGGTLTLNRPIYDATAGRMVQPWELVRDGPGNLIRVRDVAPRLDGLNATDRDSVTIFRVVGATYTASGGAVLDLDSKPRRMSTLLAQQRRDFERARRR